MCYLTFDKEIEIHDIWKHQHQLPIDERLTTNMLKIIKQRQKNSIECLQCIHHLKADILQKAKPNIIINLKHSTFSFFILLFIYIIPIVVV